jgi:hypothetical protein
VDILFAKGFGLLLLVVLYNAFSETDRIQVSALDKALIANLNKIAGDDKRM